MPCQGQQGLITNKAGWFWLGVLAVAICFVFLGVGLRRSVNHPALQIDSNLIDLGSVREDEVKDVSMTLSNVGHGDLLVKFAGSTCGCATLKTPEVTVASGQSGRLTVEVQPRKSSLGPNQQAILLATNDPKHEALRLTVRWNTIPATSIHIVPDAVDGDVSYHEIITSTGYSRLSILVVDRLPQGLLISDLQTSTNVTATVHDVWYGCDSTATGKRLHAVRIDAMLNRQTPLGPFREWISFETNSSERPKVTIPWTGQVIGSGGEPHKDSMSVLCPLPF